jgi:Raf kinase inhibitor-like YbhB/YbcL family protein
MRLVSTAFEDGKPIPEEFAFGKPDPDAHVALSANRNPPLEWHDIPHATRSLVLVCHDPDVPSRADDVNQQDRQVPPELARIDFYHWVLVDLPTQPQHVAAGEFSDGVSARGKHGPEAKRGTRQGVNSYSDWFAGDADMAGTYFGYDGPCPPWNDSIRHRYVFTLYALDVDHCAVDGEFRGPEVLAAVQGHVLAEAQLTGTYSLNPTVPA